jgi:hypothetical protein
VATALALERESSTDLIDVDEVVVGSDSEPLVVRGEGHDLDPLTRVLEEVDFLVGSSSGSDGDSAIVTGNDDPVSVDCKSTRALGVRESGKSGGTTALSLCPAVRNLASLQVPAAGRVPEHDLVIIGRGDNGAISLLNEAPDLTVGVGGHNGGSVATIRENDGTIALANKHLAVLKIDGTNKAVLLSGLNLLGAGINDVDLAVFTTGVELAVTEGNGRDESSVGLNGTLAGATIVTTPDVH